VIVTAYQSNMSPQDSEALLATAHRFIREEVVPLEPTMLGAPWHVVEPTLNALRVRAKALGLWAPFLPAQYGGRDMPLDAFARLSEVLGWTPFGHYVCNCQAPDVGNMELLLAFGTEAQKREYLEPLARGEIRSCFAMTEPEHAGSNPVRLSTTAVHDAGEWIINGHKWFTSSADGATFAVVMAVTDADETRRHYRASQIIVPLQTPVGPATPKYALMMCAFPPITCWDCRGAALPSRRSA
jgi:acyl-CoA dehydrogenase